MGSGERVTIDTYRKKRGIERKVERLKEGKVERVME